LSYKTLQLYPKNSKQQCWFSGRNRFFLSKSP